jgi:hypothetical protein
LINEALLHTRFGNTNQAVVALRQLDSILEIVMRNWYPAVPVAKKGAYFLINIPALFAMLSV